MLIYCVINNENLVIPSTVLTVSGEVIGLEQGLDSYPVCSWDSSALCLTLSRSVTNPLFLAVYHLGPGPMDLNVMHSFSFRI